MRLLFGITGFLALSSSAFAVPMQWGGNGHYYELISPVDGITWADARDAAAASSHLGLDGHLVTFTSQAEWDFVQTTFPQNFTWIGLTDSDTEGQFEWVTGEAFSFDAWLANEPNNAASGPGEDVVWYEERFGQWGWNDWQDEAFADTGPQQFPMSYVVEYDDVPEPASAMLLVGGVVLLSTRRRAK